MEHFTVYGKMREVITDFPFTISIIRCQSNRKHGFNSFPMTYECSEGSCKTLHQYFQIPNSHIRIIHLDFEYQSVDLQISTFSLDLMMPNSELLMASSNFNVACVVLNFDDHKAKINV